MIPTTQTTGVIQCPTCGALVAAAAQSPALVLKPWPCSCCGLRVRDNTGNFVYDDVAFVCISCTANRPRQRVFIFERFGCGWAR